jgi:hypothetical protein
MMGCLGASSTKPAAAATAYEHQAMPETLVLGVVLVVEFA